MAWAQTRFTEGGLLNVINYIHRRIYVCFGFTLNPSFLPGYISTPRNNGTDCETEKKPNIIRIQLALKKQKG